MKPKLAYIDHRIQFAKDFIQALENAGIEFKPYISFEEFNKENNMRDFPVFLCHPGLNHQGIDLEKIAKDFPHVKIGIISSAVVEYCESDTPLFSYNFPDSVIKWVRENQQVYSAESMKAKL